MHIVTVYPSPPGAVFGQLQMGDVFTTAEQVWQRIEYSIGGGVASKFADGTKAVFDTATPVVKLPAGFVVTITVQ